LQKILSRIAKIAKKMLSRIAKIEEKNAKIAESFAILDGKTC
jgi:uncharacterized coiled-coil DUF342 family protein